MGAFDLATILLCTFDTDVVDLPDVFLPEGHSVFGCMCLIDSESDLSVDLSDDELVEIP